jgi:hypothetical protein
MLHCKFVQLQEILAGASFPLTSRNLHAASRVFSGLSSCDSRGELRLALMMLLIRKEQKALYES